MKFPTHQYELGVAHLLEFLRANPIADPEFKDLEPCATAWLKDQNYVVPQASWRQFRDALVHAVVGFGPLEPWLKNPHITEIMVNGCAEIFVEEKGQLRQVPERFASNEQLQQVINRMVAVVGRRVDESQPMVDARLADGSRINAIIPPLSIKGPVLTIRKFPNKPFTVKDLLKQNSIDENLAEILELLVKKQQNILIAGGTGAGKTSTLNALASLVPAHERLVTIEDSAEIRIDHPHLIPLEARLANLEGQGQITIRDLLKNALRMRPDRILVGEIRGGEAIDMLQAMNTGHQGSITTIHANSPLESLYRLETMALMGEANLPLPAIRPQISQGLDWIIQQQRLPIGQRKITGLALVINDWQQTSYKVKTVARFDPDSQRFEGAKFCPPLIEKFGSENLKNWCLK